VHKVASSWVSSIADVTPVCENSTPTRQFPVLSSINAIAALPLPAVGGRFNLNREAYYLIEAAGNMVVGQIRLGRQGNDRQGAEAVRPESARVRTVLLCRATLSLWI